jgi:hypothetical protein
MEENIKKQLLNAISGCVSRGTIYCDVNGEKVRIIGISNYNQGLINVIDTDNFTFEVSIDNIKPYFRKFQTLTEDEKGEMYKDCYVLTVDCCRKTTDMVALPNAIKVVDYLLGKNIDVYDLIGKGVALDMDVKEKN